MLILVSLVCIVIVLIYLYLNKNKNYWKNKNVVQFDGVFRSFLVGNRSIGELYKEIYDRYPDEKYVGIVMGSRHTLMLKDLDDINFVLQGDFQNFHSRGIVTNPNDILADNLLFMNDYRRWRLLRQKISPVFTHKKLKNMFYIMEKCARDFVEFIENNANMRNKPFNALYTYTTASIGASVFGIDTHSKNTMDCPFMDMAWNIFEPNLLDNLKFVIANYSPSLFKILKLTNFKKFEKFFFGVIKTVLESRRKSKETRYDFIDTCLELQQSGILRDVTTGYEVEPTDEVLAPQAFFFFIAGADPSANTMHFVLLELSYNPVILQEVHTEIDKVFNYCEGNLQYEDVDKLVYLDMVINEALRKYPPISVIQRACINSTVLPSGLKIEKNTIALIPIFAIHRDEKYYTTPDLYEPDRFAPENVSNLVKNAYLPFGGGNRGCIGYFEYSLSMGGSNHFSLLHTNLPFLKHKKGPGLRFARLQVKAGLALLLRRFTLRKQSYQPIRFEPSFFSLRDPNVTYELILRN